MPPRPGTTLRSFLRTGPQAGPRPAAPAAAADEQCEMCGAPIPDRHRHLALIEERELRCACTACAILFDRRAASEGRYRLIPDRREVLTDFRLTDAEWEALEIPVGLAFFFFSTPADRVVAMYPGPAGATESQLDLGAWDAVVEANPRLAGLEPDVEALLVDRSAGAGRAFVVPIDECYALVGLLRTRWRGLTGGEEVRTEMRTWFDRLEQAARAVSAAEPGADERKETDHGIA